MKSQRAPQDQTFRYAGRGSRAGWIIAGIVALLLVLAVVLPNYVPRRHVGPKNICINNLRQIDAAKESSALESKKRPGDPIDESVVNRYLKGGLKPVCPEGGTYSYSIVGSPPTCTIASHALELLPSSR